MSQLTRACLTAAAAATVLLVGGRGLGAQRLPALAREDAVLLASESTVRVTDVRLEAALLRLIQGSPTARSVLAALAESDLPVVVGTHAQLASLPDAEGGPEADERRAMLNQMIGLGDDRELQKAWVAFRARVVRQHELVERAWILIDVEGIERLIRAQGRPDSEARIQNDLTIALGHELVGHVGSIARTKDLDDFCDDPSPAASRLMPLGCSIRVENKVRRELNDNLHLQGARRFQERRSYGLEVMNFGSGG
jgi:hypothetical protein